MKNPQLVTIKFEGVQGAGKSLLVKAVAAHLRSLGISIDPSAAEHDIMVLMNDYDRAALAVLAGK